MEFLTDLVLSKEDICNYAIERKALLKGITLGKNQVVYGRRNTGKTSLIKNQVIHEFLENHPKSLAIFVDFLSVKSLSDIGNRIRISFEKELSRVHSSKIKWKQLTSVLKRFRPKISIDPMTSEASISLALEAKEEDHLELLFEEILRFYKTPLSVLLEFDEFQDISFIPGAEAKLRTIFQHFPTSLPIIVLGSKKHLLSKMFADPKSAFANWGHDLELPPITATDYQSYINERLKPVNLNIPLEETQYLLNVCQNIPECVNLICDSIKHSTQTGTVNTELINKSLMETLSKRSSRYEEMISHFSENETKFLVALSKNEPVKEFTGKSFLSKTDVSASGIHKMAKKLEDNAAICRIKEGYVVGDPLLSKYLQKFR